MPCVRLPLELEGQPLHAHLLHRLGGGQEGDLRTGRRQQVRPTREQEGVNKPAAAADRWRRLLVAQPLAEPAGYTLTLSIDEEIGYGSARSRVTVCGGQAGATTMKSHAAGQQPGAPHSACPLPPHIVHHWARRAAGWASKAQQALAVRGTERGRAARADEGPPTLPLMPTTLAVKRVRVEPTYMSGASVLPSNLQGCAQSGQSRRAAGEMQGCGTAATAAWSKPGGWRKGEPRREPWCTAATAEAGSLGPRALPPLHWPSPALLTWRGSACRPHPSTRGRSRCQS